MPTNPNSAVALFRSIKRVLLVLVLLVAVPALAAVAGGTRGPAPAAASVRPLPPLHARGLLGAGSGARGASSELTIAQARATLEAQFRTDVYRIYRCARVDRSRVRCADGFQVAVDGGRWQWCNATDLVHLVAGRPAIIFGSCTLTARVSA